MGFQEEYKRIAEYKLLSIEICEKPKKSIQAVVQTMLKIIARNFNACCVLMKMDIGANESSGKFNVTV